MDDSNLLERARNGDEAAFLDLYRQHREPIFRFAYRIRGSVESAEDLTQECFLELLRGRFDPARGTALRTWLLAVVRNLALKQARRSVRELLAEDAEPATEPDALARAIAFETGEAVRAAVAALPLLQREAIVLFEYEGLSLAEIANIVSADVGAVKARLSRARERLRRALAPFFRREVTA